MLKTLEELLGAHRLKNREALKAIKDEADTLAQKPTYRERILACRNAVCAGLALELLKLPPEQVDIFNPKASTQSKLTTSDLNETADYAAEWWLAGTREERSKLDNLLQNKVEEWQNPNLNFCRTGL